MCPSKNLKRMTLTALNFLQNPSRPVERSTVNVTRCQQVWFRCVILPGEKMASNAISDITDEFLVCQVCLEDFRQPKVLPCLHTFCKPCLDRLLATEPVGKLDCPTCRQDVPLPENGVQGLKSNFLVGKLRDILQQQPKGETSEAREDGVPCTVCEAGNSAQFYCVECPDYLCQTCKDMHRRFKVSKDHKTVTIQDLQSGQAAAELRGRETSKCEDHQELNKFYCDTCHRVICLHCVVTAHKDHQYVEIEKAAEREGAKIKEKQATVKNTADLHEKWIQDLQSVKDEWSSQVQRSEEQIRKQVKSIIGAAKKVGNDRIAQLRAMNAAREKQMEAAMEAAEMDLASAKSCVQFTDNVLEYGSPAELMSVAGELTERLDQTADEKKADKAEMTKDFVNLTVEPSTYNVEQEVSKLVGEITKTAIQMLSSPPTLTTQVRHNMAIGKGDGGLKRIKVVGENRFGQFQGLTSLAVTAEGDIVATGHGNSRLQFLGKDGSFKKKVNLRFKPLSVAALTNGELLVTGDGHRIHVLDKQGRESRVIQVPGAEETGRTTRGVAVDGLGRIIVTIGRQVFKLSPGGDVMMRIGGEDQGQQYFGSSLRVAVNSRNQIIVSDWCNNKMMMFDSSGRHLFTCGSLGSGPGQLCSPQCVITDSEDDIIVSDCNNNRVSLFSRDGTFIRHVLTKSEHSLCCPMGLAVSYDGHLIVSDYNTITFFM
ncbi:tripartite motif-containing protein 2-like [Branchiostoma floridae]|uniref:RING-type E3 ubiquitin transferase n=1 Tax=Branchiostoma floridae TaxID=7739 RepID=A0A9J7L4B0_BRAFL|nr:tripartite motif-containing protein 2-like [Branchiostoma floridae]